MHIKAPVKSDFPILGVALRALSPANVSSTLPACLAGFGCVTTPAQAGVVTHGGRPHKPESAISQASKETAGSGLSVV